MDGIELEAFNFKAGPFGVGAACLQPQARFSLSAERAPQRSVPLPFLFLTLPRAAVPPGPIVQEERQKGYFDDSGKGRGIACCCHELSSSRFGFGWLVAPISVLCAPRAGRVPGACLLALPLPCAVCLLLEAGPAAPRDGF